MLGFLRVVGRRACSISPCHSRQSPAGTRAARGKALAKDALAAGVQKQTVASLLPSKNPTRDARLRGRGLAQCITVGLACTVLFYV